MRCRHSGAARAAVGLAVALTLLAAAVGVPAAEPAAATPALANPFFVFNNGVSDAAHDTPAKQVALVRQAGFDGMEKNELDGLVETLVDLGFGGPVGLQCYNVPGDGAEHLAQSMAAWRACRQRIAGRR